MHTSATPWVSMRVSCRTSSPAGFCILRSGGSRVGCPCVRAPSPPACKGHMTGCTWLPSAVGCMCPGQLHARVLGGGAQWGCRLWRSPGHWPLHKSTLQRSAAPRNRLWSRTHLRAAQTGTHGLRDDGSRARRAAHPTCEWRGGVHCTVVIYLKHDTPMRDRCQHLPFLCSYIPHF